MGERDDRNAQWQALRKESEQIIADEKAGIITNARAGELWNDWRARCAALRQSQEGGRVILL